MRYKVLKTFITKKALYEPGGVYIHDNPGNFTKRLLEYGFIKELPEFVTKDFAEWERKGIKSKLANILIAPEDYVEGDKKHFTWDEAMALEKKLPSGWRLPSRHEIVLIAEEFGRNLETDELEGQWLQKNLGLGLNGYIYDSLANNVGSYGYYWSRTAYSSTSAYNLYVNNGGYVDPASSSNRYYGFSVRCVKDLES